ncbi:hypothetical protein ACFQY0_14025 [Haloferula chungangensis]|uniref:Zinc finger/thioredoxin putative domain-containing protein n=1 Tax=Haloferula chungangensis TaxID=1048331 RepID=A0ABW2LAC2_9BACT
MASTDSLIELKCKNCGSQLSPEDISPQLAAARCKHCNALFAIPTAAPRGSEPLPRPKVPLPPGFEIHTAPNALQITRRWRSGMAWFLLFFTIFWNGFMIVWHTMALSSGMWHMSLFGIIHTAVGIGLAYTVAASFLNSTAIRCQPGSIQIEHGPLPWKGNLTLDTNGLQQLYVSEKINRGKNGSSTSYQLEAVLRDKRRKTLIKNLTDPDQALFIEQEIEELLKIRDRSVVGEYSR